MMDDNKGWIIKITVRGHGALAGYLGREGAIMEFPREAMLFTSRSVAIATAKSWNDRLEHSWFFAVQPFSENQD